MTKRKLNEKIGSICNLGFCTVLSAIILILAGYTIGCKTVGGSSVDDISANQRAAQRIENIQNDLIDTIDRSSERVESIRETANGISDSIDRLEYLFGQYQQEVQRLIGSVKAISDQIEREKQDNNGVDSSTDWVDSSKDSSDSNRIKIPNAG